MVNAFVKYLDIPLPSIQKTLEEVKKTPNIWECPGNYTLHECGTKLSLELKKSFPNFTSYKYQSITDGLPIHKDIDRTSAVNFILNAGGKNVETVWYDDDYNEIHRECIESNRWHEIDVSVFHTVEGITTDERLSITLND